MNEDRIDRLLEEGRRLAQAGDPFLQQCKTRRGFWKIAVALVLVFLLLLLLVFVLYLLS